MGAPSVNHSNSKCNSHLLHPLDLQLHPTFDLWNTIFFTVTRTVRVFIRLWFHTPNGTVWRPFCL